jgi:hypothetical protein
MADEQQTPIGRQADQLGESLASFKTSGQRRVHRQQYALLRAPVLPSKLSGLARAYLGTEQDGVEVESETRQRDPSGARLTFATRGKAALCVRASAMRLCLGVT